ncbi:Glucose/arabinose dehydrogenase, beta-propeller fold [Cognatiyoonia koreensis]|uniref:Glucose/arabinose dehydrogenase, beta-propeller fold n=2 Tax=Cognatiyoonia koreensis TaxID=364200 RepID=A0A1I0RLT0_9RHOB|nr:PQQ-dependent sugar dehydrogenase [Cognatiyoonia koreensis]SEW41855.1 Glucose/arabinose dehydrogenase, beta-propeller fold [Cognatiyoonia koreensis]
MNKIFKAATLSAILATGAAAEVPQGPPNANFEPAFENQTRAPQLPKTNVEVSNFAEGLEHPWGIARLPDGRYLVTERPGRLRLVGADGGVSGEIAGLPTVDNRGQGGLLDVALSHDFENDQTVYWTYAKGVPGGTVTAAARGVFSEGGEILDARDIFVQQPPSQNPMHYGSRIIPMPDGMVWITTGEHSVREDAVKAQDINITYGKVIRVTWDGLAPMDNPYVGENGDDAVWSYGHRNIQGAALDASGALWTIEHGPRGGDELNKPEAAKNYGWPAISYGINYNGSPVGGGEAVAEGMEQPVYYWDPVIAPGGMVFYDGPFAPWQGDLIIASLRPGGLVRLELEDGRVVGEERLLTDVGRVRDVELLPDGSLLALLDAADGGILRVTPTE